jgi:membrane protease YdiL (CAAX protease family)
MAILKRYEAVLISSLLLVYFIWNFVVEFIYNNLTEVQLNYFEGCIVAPLWEEAVYRYAPIEVCLILNEKLVIPVMIAVSLIFGFGHEEQPVNVLLQGIMGLLLVTVYLNAERLKYLKVVIVHAFWNFICIKYFKE